MQISLQTGEYLGMSLKDIIYIVMHLRINSYGASGLGTIGGEFEEKWWRAYLWSVKEKHQHEFKH